ncbi:cation:proton antiporter [Vibrio sp. S4M6]|uniref:cation:proton antiporter family protein n=1 Tax=Vibrio sinus TaxID=2946865 RepID=UPI00202A6482|nr:cation:proton antiporter family protein [Vibrio sinus]MCL9782571.1 cation:proton antiporter [Vibrio sinus]
MELVFISSVFVAGFIAVRCHLPPLVGFLFAGFVLHYYGFQTNETIQTLSELGVTLLLFTIGLKLDIKVLLAKEIWASATIHNVLSTLIFSAFLLLLKVLGVSFLSQLPFMQLVLLGFALSFSSTVFAVKSIQDKGDMNATYGMIAIGILVMQDIFAVIFLTASTGQLPHWYAIALFALPLLRPFFFKLLDKVGHGEMLVLFGIFFALVMGAGLFHLVGMKPDLGALILGMLLAGHKKASELSKSLFNLKELFLVCFFLDIGLQAQPTLVGVSLAILFLLLLPIKGVLYFWVLHKFKFRVRTSLFTSLALFNFSEFGLIVGALAYQMNWINNDVMVSIAIAVSISFVIASPFNRKAHSLYRKVANHLKEHKAESLNKKDQLIHPGEAQVLIFGMGRIGTGAYDELTSRFGNIALGVDINDSTAEQHQHQSRNVIAGDATDPDFWERILDTSKVKLILLAMPHHQGNQAALEQLQKNGFSGQIAAIAAYSDQIDTLLESGADAAFNIYHEAGSGFAQHVYEKLKPNFHKVSSP